MNDFLSSTDSLYSKAIREASRAYLCKNKKDCGDHFFNFCITVHSLRDWTIKELDLNESDFHELCNKVEYLRWCRDIANGSKHMTLKIPDKNSVASIKSINEERVALSLGSINPSRSEHPAVTINTKDGKEVDLLTFLFNSLKAWNDILKESGLNGDENFGRFALEYV